MADGSIDGCNVIRWDLTEALDNAGTCKGGDRRGGGGRARHFMSTCPCVRAVKAGGWAGAPGAGAPGGWVVGDTSHLLVRPGCACGLRLRGSESFNFVAYARRTDPTTPRPGTAAAIERIKRNSLGKAWRSFWHFSL